MDELAYEVRTALVDLHRIIEDHSRALVEALGGAPAVISYPPAEDTARTIRLNQPVRASADLEAIVQDRMAAAFFEWLNVLDGTHDPEVLDGDPWLGVSLEPAGDGDRPLVHDAFFDSWHEFVRTRPID